MFRISGDITVRKGKCTSTRDNACKGQTRKWPIAAEIFFVNQQFQQAYPSSPSAPFRIKREAPLIFRGKPRLVRARPSLPTYGGSSAHGRSDVTCSSPQPGYSVRVLSTVSTVHENKPGDALDERRAKQLAHGQRRGTAYFSRKCTLARKPQTQVCTCYTCGRALTTRVPYYCRYRLPT